MTGHPNSEAEESKIQIDTGLFVDWVSLRKSKIMIWKANLLMWTLQHDEVLHWTESELHELHAVSFFHQSLCLCVHSVFLYLWLSLSLSLSLSRMHAQTHTHTHTHKGTTEAQNQYTVCLNTEIGSQANWNLEHFFPGNTHIAYKIEALRVLPIAFCHFMKCLTFLGISWNALLHGLPVTHTYIYRERERERCQRCICVQQGVCACISVCQVFVCLCTWTQRVRHIVVCIDDLLC